MKKYEIDFYFSPTQCQTLRKNASSEAELSSMIQQREYVKSDPQVGKKTIVINMSNVLFYTINEVE
ncbi:hypothetical protein [Priestia aryabhattai]|uniref:hypothetical protein n=1 Tax=Priestia aryabhattai TaxID=412384 RepID=UPI002380AA1F|nr:hypothetical protein [Priestia aryabhattai]WDW09387.1 hypothetical protein PWC21_02070 [Priestia aryabhattai]